MKADDEESDSTTDVASLRYDCAELEGAQKLYVGDTSTKNVKGFQDNSDWSQSMQVCEHKDEAPKAIQNLRRALSSKVII